MATFVAIPEKTQTANAMKRVLNYIMQDKKTNYNGANLVSGQNCIPESAYEEFMATKNSFGKAKGVFFKQYVQSFKPDCGVTPQTIHKIGLELAQAFDGFEVVVATHIDRDHWHNHFVVNSVNCETGYKIQINEKGLEELRRKSDEICERYGLETLKPYEKPQQRSMNQKEYRAALRGESKKLKLANAIDYAVAVSRTKQQFIDEMSKLGYGIKWVDSYKYITYTTPDGQRFRDNRLPENKYLKSNMEVLFNYGYEKIKTTESDRIRDERNGEIIDRTDTTDVLNAETGAVQSDSETHFVDWESHCREHGFDIKVAYPRRFGSGNGTNSKPLSEEINRHSNRQIDLNEPFSRGQIIETDELIGEVGSERSSGYAEGTESQRFDSLEEQGKMGTDWGSLAVSGLYLAADLAMIGETDKEGGKKKYVKERKNKRNKKQSQEEDESMQLSM
jgi:hypothetical protein